MLVGSLCGALGCIALQAEAAPSSSAVNSASASRIEPPQLLERVQLDYPESAHDAQIHGDVVLLVDVDERGQVTDARVDTGHEVFREAALSAAIRLKFKPAQRDGQPLAVTTRVSLHFAPPHDDGDDSAEIVVHADNPDRADTRARTTLDAKALEKSAGDGLADAIAETPGVQAASGTSDSAKPIIRGHQERRLLVLFDGVRHESQKWGSDHATEIDPFSAGTISIIRGAAGARYGPDAIGGVILVAPPPLRSEVGVGGKTLLGFASNGLRPYGALRLDMVPASAPKLSFRIEGNASRGASLSTPTYVLGNTASATWNLGGAVGYRWQHGALVASYHRHDFQAGVFYGLSHHNPDEFKAQLVSDRPVTADLWSTSYRIDRPYQQVSHDRAILKTKVFGQWGELQAFYSYQHNHRREFDQVRGSITGPQFDFTLRTHSVDGLYTPPTLYLPFGELKGGVGIQGQFQENVYRGRSLLPNYRSFSGGVFVFERLSLKRTDLEIGARYDGLSRVTYMQEDDYAKHVRRNTLNETDCSKEAGSMRCPNAYQAGSISMGALVHVVPDSLDLKFDLSTASRFPNVDELYLLGSAPTFPVYALGSPDLRVETSWGGSLTSQIRLTEFEAELSGHASAVQNYIYFAPDLTESGEPALDVTVQGTWPRYTYRPVQALVYGTDGFIHLGLHSWVGLQVQGSLVRIQDRATGEHLIGTPSDRVQAALIGRPPSVAALANTEIAISGEWVARQSRVAQTADFAPPPDGYFLLGLRLNTEITIKGMPMRVGFSAHNLLNTRYREYTSLLRYYSDQPGRDVRVRVGMDF